MRRITVRSTTKPASAPPPSREPTVPVRTRHMARTHDTPNTTPTNSRGKDTLSIHLTSSRAMLSRNSRRRSNNSSRCTATVVDPHRRPRSSRTRLRVGRPRLPHLHRPLPRRSPTLLMCQRRRADTGASQRSQAVRRPLTRRTKTPSGVRRCASRRSGRRITWLCETAK